MRALIVVLALTAVASANVGKANFAGTSGTEPHGLRGVAIARELLTIDMRPVDGQHDALVTATYHLVNHGDAVTADLVFVAGTPSGAARVLLDGAPLAYHEVWRKDVPASWRAPTTTPALDDGPDLPYEVESTPQLGFAIAIAPGEHDLLVTYEAKPARWRSKEGGTIRWQLGYVLAPARDWDGFGGLDLVVELPAGWRAATTPALAHDGDTLRGHFDALPADAFAITTQAPVEPIHGVMAIVAPILLLLALVGGAGAIIARCRARARRGVVWPTALLFGLAWGVLIGVTGVGFAVRDGFGIPAGQDAYYGYGQGIFTMFAVVAAIVAIPIGFGIGMAAAAGARPRG